LISPTRPSREHRSPRNPDIRIGFEAADEAEADDSIRSEVPLTTAKGGFHPVRRLIGFSLIAFFLVLFGAPAAGAADQCAGCHTDAAKLKALVREPKEIAEEEGAS